MKTCRLCTSTDLASRSALCKEHHREYVRAHYASNKQYYVDKAGKRNLEVKTRQRELLKEYLSTHPCVDCGNIDLEVLQFDHRDRALKITEICKLLGYSDKKLFDEVAKCDIRCANCHIKRTRRQLGWWTSE